MDPDGVTEATMAGEDREQVGASRLRAAVPAAVEPRRAAEILGAGRDRWLGELVTAPSDEGGTARYLLDLELRVVDHAPRVAFHKAAFVDIGPLRDGGEDGLSVDISWRAAGLTPLFPVFAGTMRWADGELRVDGFYAPPGGSVGVVADRLLLNVAARGTARRLLERIAETMTEPAS
jgi:hypothetical protein